MKKLIAKAKAAISAFKKEPPPVDVNEGRDFHATPTIAQRISDLKTARAEWEALGRKDIVRDINLEIAQLVKKRANALYIHGETVKTLRQ